MFPEFSFSDALDLLEEVYKTNIGPFSGDICEETQNDPEWDLTVGVLYPSETVAKQLEENNEPISLEGEGIDRFENEDEAEEIGYLKRIDGEDDEPEDFNVLNPLAKPSLIGLSFKYKENSKNPYIHVAVSYGIYKKLKGKYKRESRVFCFLYLPLKAITKNKLNLEPGVYLYLRKANNDTLEIKLVNENYNPQALNSKEKCIYQPNIRIYFNRENLELKKTPPDETLPPEDNYDRYLTYALDKAQLNRNAKGFLCAVTWEEIDYQNDKLLGDLRIKPEISKAFERLPFKWLDGDVILKEELRKKYLRVFNFRNVKIFKEVENTVDYEVNLEKLLEPHFKAIYEHFKYCKIRTDLFPMVTIPMPKLATSGDVNLNPDYLAEVPRKELEDTLKAFLNRYRNWIDKQNPQNALETKILDFHRQALDRMSKAVNRILNDTNVELAFRFANKAIAQSIKWENPKLLPKWNWRAFQIGYFLTVLNSLIDDNDQFKDVVDVLWIPTGGGKTEAYLAIMAFVAAYRRLVYNSESPNSDPKKPLMGDYGVAVLSRYTLRLLSSQQVLRTLKVITAMEYLRSSGWKPQSYKGIINWGKTRFTIGFLVGSATTPNRLHSAIQSLEQYPERDFRNRFGTSDATFLTVCPICGTYLALPEKLKSGETLSFYLLVKDIPQEVSSQIDGEDFSLKVKNLKVFNTTENITSLEIEIKNFLGKEIPLKPFLDRFKANLESRGAKVVSINPMTPGYVKVEWNRNKAPQTLELICPNPDCNLNKQLWNCEKYPTFDAKGHFQGYDDLKNVAKNNSKWIFNHIPIPLKFIDEEIFLTPPTILISTVDKFALIPLDPEARYAHLFNNVNKIDKGVFLREKESFQSFYIPPPQLIVQDELHLIQGTLGSYVGFYETLIAELCKGSYNDLEFKPKYIASSATIKNVEEQTKRVFKYTPSPKPAHFLFPPYALSLSDNFFTRYPERYIHPLELLYNDEKGRIYIGLFGAGKQRARQTQNVYKPLLKVIKRKNYPNKHPYRTIVGYYNSLKELGAAQSIVIHELKVGGVIYEELSSRVPSWEIPKILEDLQLATRAVDVIFATSMFGTGVDIPRLSLMVMDGIPKQIADYIQATGRVGRKHPALVFVLANPVRPREVSIFEYFTNFHLNIPKFVEAIPVFPFTRKIVKKVGGSLLVGLLRNLRQFNLQWKENNAWTIAKDLYQNNLSSIYHNDLKQASQIINNRSQIAGKYALKINFYSVLVSNTSYGFMKIRDIYNYLNQRNQKLQSRLNSRGTARGTIRSIYFFRWRIQRPAPQVLTTLEQSYALKHHWRDEYCCIYRNILTSLRTVEDEIQIKFV